MPKLSVVRAAATGTFVALLTTVAGCSESTSVPRTMVVPADPSAQIVDATNGGAVGFNFISPIKATLTSFPAAFDGTRTPVVEVCKWVSGACSGPLVANFSGTAITVSTANSYYSAAWSTSALPVGVLYRIRVREGALELGYADAKKPGPGESASALAAQKIVVLGNSSSLAIRFRISVRVPTQISLNAGNNQTATAGTALSTPPSVLVRDANNSPVSGVAVTFAVAGGGGSIANTTVTTDANGLASSGIWTLGPSAGGNTLTATAAGLSGSPVIFTATGTAGVATQISMNGGNGQMATSGTAVSIAPSVLVRDVNGNPVAGVEVTFAVTGGGGSATGATAITGADGIATVGSWTMGSSGANAMTASVAGLTGSPVNFTATATVGAAAQLVQNAGDAQTATVGTVLPIAPSVIAKDTYGNPVAGVSVSFAVTGGGGSSTGATATTDANGIAAVASWTLGTTAGTNTLSATASGLTGSPLSFTATGTAGAGVMLQIVTQVVAAASNVAFSPQSAVRLRDAYANLKSGTTVTVSIANGSGTLGGTVTATTDANGIATFSGLSLIGSGNFYLRFSVTAGPSVLSEMVTVQQALASIVGGGFHTCGLTAGGAAYCWGNNAYGQLGDNSSTQRHTPTPVIGGLTFTSITAGQIHTCGITAAGDAYCWGYSGNGQLGNGTTATRLTPTLVTGGLSFTKLSAGYYHTCGLTSSGAAYCWGNNDNGGLGDNSTTSRPIPTLVSGGLSFASVSAGIYHSCGRSTTGAAYCWGYNGYGQLGDNSTTQKLTPTLVSGGISFVSVIVGGYHSCGRTSAGAAYCWGLNNTGQVGDNSTTSRFTPAPVSGGIPFASLSAGFYHACGLTAAGVAHCWGRNSDGQLGDNTLNQRQTPTIVSGGLTFLSLSAGGDHTAGRTSGGLIYTWGYNGYGQLGNSGTNTRLTPTLVY